MFLFLVLLSISCFGSTGEASNVDEYLWLMGRAHYSPIIEYCGGTEIGGSFITGSLLQPQSLAAFSTPAMGCKLFILGENGNPLVRNKLLCYRIDDPCSVSTEVSVVVSASKCRGSRRISSLSSHVWSFKHSLERKSLQRLLQRHAKLPRTGNHNSLPHLYRGFSSVF